MVLLFYTTYISVDLAHYEIFHAKVGKSGRESMCTKYMYWLTAKSSLPMKSVVR